LLLPRCRNRISSPKGRLEIYLYFQVLVDYALETLLTDVPNGTF